MPAVNGQRFEDDFREVTLGNLAPLGATKTWRNAQAVVELMAGPGQPNLNYELDFETSTGSIANVSGIGFFGGRINSFSSGLATVTGTLDLGGFGSGSDAVLVWSLSELESATVRPPVVQMQRTESAAARPGGPNIGHHRTRQRVGVASSTVHQRSPVRSEDAAPRFRPPR